jgi:hypothetical protein
MRGTAFAEVHAPLALDDFGWDQGQALWAETLRGAEERVIAVDSGHIDSALADISPVAGSHPTDHQNKK